MTQKRLKITFFDPKMTSKSGKPLCTRGQYLVESMLQNAEGKQSYFDQFRRRTRFHFQNYRQRQQAIGGHYRGTIHIQNTEKLFYCSHFVDDYYCGTACRFALNKCSCVHDFYFCCNEMNPVFFSKVCCPTE